MPDILKNLHKSEKTLANPVSASNSSHTPNAGATKESGADKNQKDNWSNWEGGWDIDDVGEEDLAQQTGTNEESKETSNLTKKPGQNTNDYELFYDAEDGSTL